MSATDLPKPETNRVSPPSRARARRVLVPIDFSAGSFEILRMAQQSARNDAAAEVHAVHVYQEPKSRAEIIRHHAYEPFSGLDDVRAALAARLEFAGLSDVRLTIVTGNSATQGITRAASRLGCDLIMIARKTKSGLSGLLSRSLPEQIAKKAPCSVLLV